MLLHLPTLLLALAVGFALLTLELAVAQPRLRSRPELWRWAQGSWMLLLGFAALAARPQIPLWLSVLVGNGAVAWGVALYADALHRLLRGQPAPRWVGHARWLCLLLLLPMVGWPLAQRTAAFSLLLLVLLWPSLQVLYAHGWQAERSLRTVTVTMSLAALALLVRAAHAWNVREDYLDLTQPSLGQSLTVGTAYLSLLGAGFAFVLAVCERVSDQLEDLATHDALTGCLNRGALDTLMLHELNRARREGRPLAFVLLDIDHFKHINDQHGHRSGDEVLRRFVQTVQQRLRASDALGRMGGEEFGLLLPGTDAAGARVLVEAVRQAVEQASWHAEGATAPLRITVSAGVAVAAPDQEATADRLYGRADQSLYEAKRGGRNRVEVYGASTVQGSLLPEA